MKSSILRHICILTLIISLAGCVSDDYDPDGSLKPSATARYLNASTTRFSSYLPAPFSETFSVESYQTAWRFSDVSAWFRLTPESGRESASVTIDVDENRDADSDRTAIFYLISDEPGWDFSRAMSVSQGKAIPSLSVDETSLSYGGGAAEQKVNITANCMWTATCSDSWVTLSPDVNSGVLAIAVSANQQNIYRYSTIYISYGNGKTVSIKITQSPAAITSSASILEYDNAASRYDVTIESETDWTSAVSDSWITVTPDNGKAGSTSVSIEVTPNTAISSRNGYVAFKTGTTERFQITIRQKGIFIEADESLTFTSAEESKKLTIHSNTSWTVTGKPTWLTLSKETGEGDGEITVTASENPNTTSRYGEIVLSQAGLSIQCKVNVTQSGKSLSTDVTLLEFSDKASQMTFNLVSDAPWTSTQTANWFSATPSSGRGDALITVSTEENNTTEERTGTINYAYADKSEYVNVHQLAKYMTIDNRSFEFDSKGGSHTIELSTNDEWTAKVEHNVSWLKLSKSSGTGNAVITLTAEDNASVNTRSTAVVINTKYSQNIRILVSQKPRHLSVSTQSVLFFANGGTSEVITIDTDGAYEIKSDASWFTVNKGTGNTFTVYATKNPSNEVRRGTITISLTDLTEGSLALELTVSQTGEGGSFIINGYPEDKDWNHVGGDTFSISIKAYTSDKNWDESFGGTLNVKVTGFSTDLDWNGNYQ